MCVSGPVLCQYRVALHAATAILFHSCICTFCVLFVGAIVLKFLALLLVISVFGSGKLKAYVKVYVCELT